MVFTESKRQSQMEEDSWIKVTTYEDAYGRIQDATGVSDIEVRFLNEFFPPRHLFDFIKMLLKLFNN